MYILYANIWEFYILMFVKTRNSNGETGFVWDNTEGEVLSMETNLAFVATAN